MARKDGKNYQGRPNHTFVRVWLHNDIVYKLDQYAAMIAERGMQPNRSQAVRQLLERSVNQENFEQVEVGGYHAD